MTYCYRPKIHKTKEQAYICTTTTQKHLLNLNIHYTFNGDTLSSLISIQHQENLERENNDYSCEACGRPFESPIRLTNLSAMPREIYNACPFCFTKLDGNEVIEELDDLASTSQDSNISKKNQKSIEDPKRVECPHYFGYLKKRPKNKPISDTCLTCQKMIQCLL